MSADTNQLEEMYQDASLEDWKRWYHQLHTELQSKQPQRPHLWKVSYEWKWEDSDPKGKHALAYFSTVTDDIPALRKEIDTALGNQYRLSAILSAEYLGRIRNINDQ